MRISSPSHSLLFSPVNFHYSVWVSRQLSPSYFIPISLVKMKQNYSTGIKHFLCTQSDFSHLWSPHMLACCHNGTAWRTATHHSRVLAPLTSSPPKLFLTIRSYIFLSYIFLAFLCAGDTNIQLIILVGFVKLFCCTLLNLLLASRVCTPISVYLYVWCGVFHVALLSSQSNRSTAAFLCEVSALESLLANTSQELVKSRIDVSSVLR